jgi:peptide deformylase
MVRRIWTVKDELDKVFLQRVCVQAESYAVLNAEDVVRDLLETARVHTDDCAGLAANQIGFALCICAVKVGDEFMAFINPRIVRRDGGIQSGPEGCLSIPRDERTPLPRVRRHKIVVVESDNQPTITLRGFEARVMQHEMDHFQGILI